MKQPDREKFQEAMRKECKAHYKEGNYLRELLSYPVYGK
jgi:hypothetical protein